jgi:hypothetical protein
MINEIFKDIPTYEGIYQVSNLGRVKSLERYVNDKGGLRFQKERVLKPAINSRGYYIVVLTKNGKMKTFKLHMLLAIVFLNHNPDGTTKIVVDHINNNPLDNRLENLQLISHRENISKSKKGTSKYTGVYFNNKLKKWQSQITINYKNIYLGIFENEYEARLAYQKALVMYNNGDLSFIKYKKYSSQYKGVYWNKNRNKWQVGITIDGKQKHIGYFTDEHDAHLAYQKALEEIKKAT